MYRGTFGKFMDENDNAEVVYQDSVLSRLKTGPDATKYISLDVPDRYQSHRVLRKRNCRKPASSLVTQASFDLGLHSGPLLQMYQHKCVGCTSPCTLQRSCACSFFAKKGELLRFKNLINPETTPL